MPLRPVAPYEAFAATLRLPRPREKQSFLECARPRRRGARSARRSSADGRRRWRAIGSPFGARPAIARTSPTGFGALPRAAQSPVEVAERELPSVCPAVQRVAEQKPVSAD